MNARLFDTLTRLLARHPSRRALLPGLGALLLAPLDAGAKKKRKKKKITLCLDGQTLTVPKTKKKKRRKLLKRGATPGACSGCTPNCNGTTCGGSDGCGGACGCPAGSLCHGDICQTCTIACLNTNHVCDGTALRAALAGGGTVYVCPGRYTGTFAPGPGSIIGAGDGDDPATSTILDAQRGGRVMDITTGRAVSLQGIRLQGGFAERGGGMRNNGALELTDCTVTGNEATEFDAGIESSGALTLTRCRVTSNRAGDAGGGIGVNDGTTTLVRSVVSQNEAANDGGGISVGTKGTLRVTEGSQITGNKAGFIGGGIHTSGTVVFDSSSSVTNNTSPAPSGIRRFAGTVTLNGATVSGNTPPPQCTDGIVGCP